MNEQEILLVDDDEIFRESLATILKKRSYACDMAVDGIQALSILEKKNYDIIITDLEMPGMNGLQFMQKVLPRFPKTFFIIITAYATMETAIEALRLGAYDYLIKPFKFENLTLKLEKLIEHRNLILENQILRREINREYDFQNIIGKSPAMQQVFRTIRAIASSDTNILITGKSGTGKELVARAIHYNSPRSSRPFVPVNCSAIPETLIESELFGHKKGSFTDAYKDREGLFQIADGGTLFLDEIGEIPLTFQPKLLRAIENKEIRPIGSKYPFQVNLRIITATNRDLSKEVEAGRFRGDLFYRLNVVELKLPTLSERKQDIPLLVEYFISRFNKQMGKKIQGATPEVIRILESTSWRGEVRELENVIERAMIFAEGEMIRAQDLPKYLVDSIHTPLISDFDSFTSLDEATRTFQKSFILKALREHNNHRGKTAQALGISEPTLYRRMTELRIKT